MNFFNPYYSIPFNYVQPKVGLLQRLFGSTGVSIGNFINGTQRVLNLANQTIPIVKQVKPMIGNARTMLKVMNEFKRNETQVSNQTSQTKNNNFTNNNQTIVKEKIENSENGPTFFI